VAGEADGRPHQPPEPRQGPQAGAHLLEPEDDGEPQVDGQGCHQAEQEAAVQEAF